MEESPCWKCYKGNIRAVWHIAYDIINNIFKVKKDDPIPADIILLRTSDKNGICYIETKNLDGETNLKSKVIPTKLQELFSSDNEVC